MEIGPLMLDLEGTSLSSEEKSLLMRPAVGGVIFFARNFESPLQLIGLVDEIRRIRPGLLLAVDQEGGRVQRFRDGFTRIPPMQKLGDLLAEGVEDVREAIHACGWLMASEVLSLGVDFSFAPVLDVDRDRCEVIGDRAFSDVPENVITAAGMFIAGMHEAGMAATGKHFPGHGAVIADSHLETPVDGRSLSDVQNSDLRPFRALAAQLDGIMPAHILFPAIDERLVGFSPFWLQRILRQELGFQGVIFSDDLSMKGADSAGDYCDKARAALDAGCDMVLVCNHRAGAEQVLCDLEATGARFSTRLMSMRGKRTWDYRQLRQQPRWQQAVKRMRQIEEAG